MPDVAQLGIQITADDRASKTLQEVEGRLRLTESAVDGLSATTVVKGGLIAGAMLAVGTAALKMAEQGVHAAADLQHAVASISTIKPDVDTSAVFKSLNDLQTQVPQTAKQLGDSLYDVFSSIDNVTEAQGLKLVETFAKGAVAAQTDAKTFGTAISGVLNAYKLDVSQASTVSDVFFNTVNRGVVTGPQLAAGLGPAIAAAKALGVSYEEAFALVVGATKEGGDAAQNINNITNLLAKLPTKEATTDLNALGIATQTAAGALRSPIEVLTDLKAKLDTMGEAARATTLLTIFPDVQARQGAQVIMSQLDTVKTALAENRTATNSTAEAYAKMSATAVEQGKLLSNTWTALLTDLSVVALPALVGALGLVGAGVRDLRETFETASTAVGEASTTIQTKTTAIKGDLDTLTTYADTNLRPQWDAFWKAATGGNYQMGPLPTPPPAPTLAQQAGAAGLGPTAPQYVPGVTPASPEQTRSPFGGAGAGHLSPEEAGLGPLGNIRGQFENMLEDMADANAARATAMGDTLAENFAGELNRRRPMMQAAGVELGDATAEGITAAVEAAAPAARSAALVTRDLEEARKRVQIADLGGAVAIREHTEALHQDEIAALGGAVAVRDHADALARQQVAALGGATAIRDHDEALARDKEQALGGALAIRSHEEALAREHEQALGGALAIREHDEALAQEKEQALGGALAIRAHAEALTQQKEAALGGALAIRDHDEALQREKDAALGGAVAIRSHQEALAREQEANLGGAVAIRDHADALQRQHDQALGGAVAIRDHDEALQRDKEANLGGLLAMQSHTEALQRQHDAALGGALGMRTHEEALARDKVAALGGAQAMEDHAKALANEQAAALRSSGVMQDLANVITQVSLTRAQDTLHTAAGTKATEDYYRTLTPTLAQTKAYADELLRQADAYAAVGKAADAAALRESAARTAAGALDNPFANIREGAARGALGGGELPAAAGVDTTAAAGVANAGGTQIGAALDQGIQQGVQDNAGVVTGAVGDLVQQALQRAKADLGIASPSVVMAQRVGLPIAQGIGQGITAGTSAVTGALQSLADATTAGAEGYFTNMQAATGYSLRNWLELITGQMRQTDAEVDRMWSEMRDRQMQQWADAYNLRQQVIHGDAPDPGAFSGTDQGAGSVFDPVIKSIGPDGPVMGGFEAVRDAGTAAFQAVGHAAAGAADATVAAMTYMTQAIDQTAEQARRSWGAALQAGAMLVAGLNVGVGRTYNELYGQTATQGTGTTGLVGTLGTPGAYQNLLPGNYGGVPVVSPVTAGTLRGYADGGMIMEPSYLTNVRTGRTFGMMAEHGPEAIGGGGGTIINVSVNVSGADALRDPRLYEQMLDRGLTQAMQKRRLI